MSVIAKYRTTKSFDRFEKKFQDLMGIRRITDVSEPRIRKRSQLLKDFVIEESIGERSNDKVELEAFLEVIDVTLKEFDARFSEY